jgi:hypothetical protein
MRKHCDKAFEKQDRLEREGPPVNQHIPSSSSSLETL